MTTETDKPEKKHRPEPTAKPPTAAVASSAPRDLPAGIPVKVLKLDRQMQLPGIPVTDVITATTAPEAGRREWRIEYIPQIRHHRISYYPHDPRKPDEVLFVHESHVASWQPA